MLNTIKTIWRRYVLMSRFDRDGELLAEYRRHPDWCEAGFQERLALRREKRKYQCERCRPSPSRDLMTAAFFQHREAQDIEMFRRIEERENA